MGQNDVTSGMRRSPLEFQLQCRRIGHVVADVHPTLLRFPLGAGSSGVRVYVTVRVTTCLTLTGRWLPMRGASKYRVLPSRAQSAGEKGERTAALRGESVAGE